MIWEDVSGTALELTLTRSGTRAIINAVRVNSTPEPCLMVFTPFVFFIMYLRKMS